MADASSRPPLSLTAVPLPNAAGLLAKVGGQPITAAMLEQDVADGAPTNPDETLNLVAYAAWLVRKTGQGE